MITASPHYAPRPASYGGGDDREARKAKAQKRVAKYIEGLDKDLAEIEASIDFDDYGPNARTPVTVSFAGYRGSYDYVTRTIPWAVFLVYVSHSEEVSSKEWCEVMTLATLNGEVESGGGRRRLEKNVDAYNIVGLDYDKGFATRAEIADRCAELGLEALILPSYSDGTARAAQPWSVDGKATAFQDYIVDRFDVKDPALVTGSMVLRYMCDEDGYCGAALGDVEVIGPPLETIERGKDGSRTVSLMIHVSHAPLPKIRVFVLLANAVERHAESNDKFAARWEAQYRAFARQVHPGFDDSGKTLERCWYVRGHPMGIEPEAPIHLAGEPYVVPEIVVDGSPPQGDGTVAGDATDRAVPESFNGLRAADAIAAMYPDKIVDKRGTAKPGVGIDCPFRADHATTKNGSHQLFVWNASNAYDAPGAKCMSESCQKKHKSLDYMAGLFSTGAPTDAAFWHRPPAQRLQIIDWTSPRHGNFTALCDKVLDGVISANATQPRLFKMGEHVVRIQPDPVTRTTKIKRLVQAGLRQEISAAVDFIKYIDKDKPKNEACPKDVAEYLFNKPDLPLPELVTVVDTPFFDADWNLVTTPGYHAASKTYYAPPEGWRMRKVPENPGPDAIKHALWILNEPLLQIPFDDGATILGSSKANWLSKLLQSFLHAPIDGAMPWYVGYKPKIRTGASLLAEIHSLIAYGRRASLQNIRMDPEEIQKTVVGLLQAGARHIVLDNVTGKVDNSTLATMGTGSIYTGRRLGTNDMITEYIRCEKELNGNNPRLSDELRERSVLIRLDAGVPNPGDRGGFKYPELLKTVERNRPALVWACLTLIRAWVVAGRPKWSGKPMGGFERANGILGGILEHAGVPGYLDNRALLKDTLGDGADDNKRIFVEMWWALFRHASVSVGSLSREATQLEYTDEVSTFSRKKIENLCDLALAFSPKFAFDFAEKAKSGWHIHVGSFVGDPMNQTFELSEKDEKGVLKPFKVQVQRNATTKRWNLRVTTPDDD